MFHIPPLEWDQLLGGTLPWNKIVVVRFLIECEESPGLAGDSQSGREHKRKHKVCLRETKGFQWVLLLCFIIPQKVHEITTLSVADMGTLPMGLLLPLTNLKSLNLSGNHMDNVSLFVLTPISTLQVS